MKIEKVVDLLYEIQNLFPYFENVEYADNGDFLQPLSIKVLKPTLEEWCSIEKIDGNSFKWYGKYYRSQEHLFKALELNSDDDLSRSTVI